MDRLRQLVLDQKLKNALLTEKNRLSKVHLKDLLRVEERNRSMQAEFSGINFDFSRQIMGTATLEMLLDFAEKKNLKEKIRKMFSGEDINFTENRPAFHVALRAQKSDFLQVSGFKINEKVSAVLKRITETAESLRKTGKVKTAVVVGIGGSCLGVEAVYEALVSFHKKEHRVKLKFLPNIDPLAYHRCLEELLPSETVLIIVSKTFTTAETMKNARAVKRWLFSSNGQKLNKSNLFAVSGNKQKCIEFGVSEDNIFEMWDWVGGRFSVSSAVGALPLSLAFGSRVFDDFLTGARQVDRHFLETEFERNIPVLMGLIGFWNFSVLGFESNAIVPYCEALKRFPAHLQQLFMESNGKRVNREGEILKCPVGEILFGEPGTCAQHSFFQLLHQGSVVPVDFIGFINSCDDVDDGQSLESHHDELMCNFFAQPEALAMGRKGESPHQDFPGNRPSLSLLFEEQNATRVGQLVALYEHRVTVQGFLWGINSFDQFGVQLGKELGIRVKKLMNEKRKNAQVVVSDNLLNKYIAGRSKKHRK